MSKHYPVSAITTQTGSRHLCTGQTKEDHMSLLDSIVARISERATLLSKQPLTYHAWHLRIQLAAAEPLAYTPGQHLRIVIGHGQAVAMRDMVRTYSVWRYDTANQVMDIVVCTFSGGAGARWVQHLQPGDTIYFRGPEGKFIADTSGDFYILIGDPSSFAHLYELYRNLPGKPIYGVLYAAHTDDHFADINGRFPLPFTTLPENPGSALIQSVNDILQQCKGKGIVYVGGDGRVCVTMSRHFRQLGWSSRQIKTKPFWMPGKKGLE